MIRALLCHSNCQTPVSKPIDFKELANKFVLTVIKFYEKLI